ncbi:MAG: substrate-binding domain-containing protein [Hyphomicrobiaceae bacterium]
MTTPALKRTILAVFAGASIAVLQSAPVSAQKAGAHETLRVQGSTTFNRRVMAPYKALIEERSGIKLEVLANKSIYGLTALLERRIDLAMISSSLKGEQKYLRSKHPEVPIDKLQVFEIARTRIAFVVHEANTVKTITVGDLRDVLVGRIKGWKDLGGADMPIAVVTVQPGGGVPTTVRQQLLDGGKITPGRLIVVEAPRNVLIITSQLKNAIGIAQLSLVSTERVHELRTDEPVEQVLNYVTFGEPGPAARKVIEATRSLVSEGMNQLGEQ